MPSRQVHKKAVRSKGDRGQKKELGALYDGAQIVQVRWWWGRCEGNVNLCKFASEFVNLTALPSCATSRNPVH